MEPLTRGRERALNEDARRNIDARRLVAPVVNIVGTYQSEVAQMIAISMKRPGADLAERGITIASALNEAREMLHRQQRNVDPAIAGHAYCINAERAIDQLLKTLETFVPPPVTAVSANRTLPAELPDIHIG